MSKAEFTCSVRVQPIEEQTDAAASRYAYAYTVRIVNTGSVGAQLIARRWVIADATGHLEEVRGLAIVGQQPFLRPGESHEYTSWTAIGTPLGTMHGTFYCMTEDAHPFEAPVPEFLLGRGEALH